MAKTKSSPALSTDALKPYVQRAMTDPELREDLLAAFVTARSIYGQMAKGSGLKAKAENVSDKNFQKQLQTLVDDLSVASDKLQGKAKKKGHKVRNRVILLTGVTLGVLYNPWTGESTREWIMDRIAGENGDGFDELAAEFNSQAGDAGDAFADTASSAKDGSSAVKETATAAKNDVVEAAKDASS
jgi:ElaB/YqjD/DUF883 family membrane-anchored ribosome-binding protein